jgi:cytochrome P450
VTIDLATVDLVSPDAVRDPHAVFARLRGLGPVHWLPRHQAWLLLDHDLVRHAMQDEELSTDTITPLYERLAPEDRVRFKVAEELLRGWMIFNDPPVHTMLRKPISSAFTPRGVSRLREEIEALTDELLDSIDPRAEQDFIASVAFPLPASVIGLLLGVSSERYDSMRDWSRQLGALVMGKVSRADAWDRALRAAEEMQDYFGDLIAANRAAPADNLVTRMIDAAEASPLTDSQLVGACSLLLFAGHETTTSLLASGVLHLSQDAAARERVLTEPGLAELAVEELLRFDGPSKILVRRVRADCTWRGYELQAGQAVYCAVMAANRDPGHFDNPASFVVDRSPNRHVGFGFGLHFCLGAQLARLEAQIVLPHVFRRFPDLRLACDPADLAWHPTIVGRTLTRLPVRFA